MQVHRQDATTEMELRGTAAELLSLAELLRSGAGSAELDRVGDPAPYDRALLRVQVARGPGLAVMRCSPGSDVLVIRGGDAPLGLIADNLAGFAEADDRTGHLHLDPFPGHDYLDVASESLVVALAAPSR